MNPFGYIFTGILVWIVYSSITSIGSISSIKLFKKLLVVEMVFTVTKFNYGYFFYFSGIEIQYGDVVLGLLFIVSIFIKTKVMSRSVNLLYLSICIGIALLFAFPSNVEIVSFKYGSWDSYFRGVVGQLSSPVLSIHSFLMFFRVIIFCRILQVAKTVINDETWVKIAHKVFNISKVTVVGIGIIEFIIKAKGFSTNIFLNYLFGRGIATGNSIGRLQGLAREPSYYSDALFIFIVLVYLLRSIDDKKRYFVHYDIWIVLAVSIGVASYSFSFVWLLFTLMILYNAYSVEIKEHVPRWRMLKGYFLGFALIICCYIVFSDSFYNYAVSSEFTYMRRVGEAIVQLKNGINGTYVLGLDFSSESVRLNGSIITIQAFLTRPIFGLGMGTAHCISGIVEILSNTGIVGLLLWTYVVMHDYPSSQRARKIAYLFLISGVFIYDMSFMYETYFVIIIPLIDISLNCDIKSKTLEERNYG